MPSSELIAGLVGPAFVAIAVAVILNRETIKEMGEQIAANYAVIFFAGVVLFVAGLAIVRAHNVWTGGWPVLVTIVGWLAILGGLGRMLFPRQVIAIAGPFGRSTTAVAVAAAVMLVVGAFLTVKGYRLDA